MPHRSTAVSLHSPQANDSAPDRPDGCQIILVKVRSGVAAGSTRRGGGIVLAEWWTLFETREQFDACAADDPLRFTDPLLYGQIKAEFDHVFNEQG